MHIKLTTKLSAFTLIEVLSVMVIVSTILLLSLGAGLSMTKTFINTLSARTLVEFIRTTKDLAIMGTEAPGQYVYALGVIFIPDNKGGYKVIRVKYSEAGTSFYKEYKPPHSTDVSNWLNQATNNTVDTFSKLYIPPQAHIVFTYHNGGTINSCDELGFFYEQLFGKPHFYCINGTTAVEINNSINIKFKETKYQIILDKNSQIYGTYKIQ